MKFVIATVFALLSTAAFARDIITITGSSTVYPFTSLVSENYTSTQNALAPIVESIGTGAGVKIFCSGVGESGADIVNASRSMKQKEIDTCAANGVTPIELKVGYDGIVFATDVNGPEFELTPEDVHKLLAANLVIDGKLVPNPYTKLSDVNASLPDWKIAFFIPGEKHGTREVFEQKVMEAGCDKDAIESAGVVKDDVVKTCVAVRKDGYVSDIDGDYSETMSRLSSDPTAVGVLGFSYFEENSDKIKVATVNGVSPSLDTIASGEYPVSRPLFIYVKKEHVGVIPGIKEFLLEYVDNAIGPDGYLVDIGLIPLSDEEITTAKEIVNNL